MISIIICSLQNKLPPELVSNIQSTIGVDYEIISIYNENNKYSIFEAYNIGISKSKYSICCFMHDDIIYHSTGWGKIVIDKFNVNNKIGAVAVAGSSYIRKMPAYWPSQFNVMNLIQSDAKQSFERTHWLTHENDQQIIIFDGLWFCIQKSLFDTIRFDSNVFHGFHFYDMDIAMQIYSAGYETYFISSVLIEHCSLGYVNEKWLDNSFLFYSKWKSKLPVKALVNECDEELEKLENVAIRALYRRIIELNLYRLILPWFWTALEVKGNLWSLLKVFKKNKPLN